MAPDGAAYSLTDSRGTPGWPLLGHESLTPTQLYTRVSIRELKEIHTATHPAARLERKGVREEPEDDPEADRAEVLVKLDEEAEEEHGE